MVVVVVVAAAAVVVVVVAAAATMVVVVLCECGRAFLLVLYIKESCWGNNSKRNARVRVRVQPSFGVSSV